MFIIAIYTKLFTGSYFPETAVVSHLYNLADGSTIEIAMVGADGATGINSLFGSQATPHQASVTIGGSARRVKTDVLRQEFERGAKFQTLMLDYFNAYLTQVSQRVACTSFHLTEKRLCSWLLMLHDRAGKKSIDVNARTDGAVSRRPSSEPDENCQNFERETTDKLHARETSHY